MDSCTQVVPIMRGGVEKRDKHKLMREIRFKLKHFHRLFTDYSQNSPGLLLKELSPRSVDLQRVEMPDRTARSSPSQVGRSNLPVSPEVNPIDPSDRPP